MRAARPVMQWCRLVPELNVSDFDASWRFYVSTVGFVAKYRRHDPEFAYLELEGSQLMIEELRTDSWVLGEVVHPFGRGMNLQIECADVQAIRDRVTEAGYGLYKDLGDAWYEVESGLSGQRQFLVPDPDGYLIRFCQHLGERAIDG